MAACAARDKAFERWSYMGIGGYRCAGGQEYFAEVAPLDARLDAIFLAMAAIPARDPEALRLKAAAASWTVCPMPASQELPGDKLLWSLFRDLAG